MIDFPASPTNGQIFIVGGKSWTWDGTKWAASGVTTTYLPLAGGTMTGDLILNRDPVVPLGAATKQYVDEVVSNDNRIINGDMLRDQRNNGVGVIPAAGPVTYTLDRWALGYTQPSKFQVRQIPNNASTIPMGFPAFMQAISQSAYTPLAGDSFYFQQRIECEMINDFAFGTASAQPITLSFWANTTVAGTYSGVVTNGTSDRAYAFTFPLAGTGLQKVVINIPGDTGGTWVLSGNAAGMNLRFDLGTGTNFRTTAGAWTNGNFVGANGTVNICATNGGVLVFTGVKLETGSIATPFNKKSTAQSFADCCRYYQKIYTTGRFYAGVASNSLENTVGFQLMRVTPTATLVTAATSRANLLASYPQFLQMGGNSARIAIAAAAAGDCYSITDLWELSAEL